MFSRQIRQGTGAVHTTTTQTASLSSSLLNTPFNLAPAAATTTRSGRKKRQNVHPCTWPGCTRVFQCPHNVQQHIREQHTFETPYACDICGSWGAYKAFARPYGLIRHKRQVHKIGKEPAQAATIPTNDFHEDDGIPDWSESLQTDEQDEFAEMRSLLTEANAEMGGAEMGGVEMGGADMGGVEMGDAGMPDSQFQFEDMSAFSLPGTQHNVGVSCGNCSYTGATQDDIFMHMHAAHQVPNTGFCACSICATMFMPSEEEAINQAVSLGNGAFQVHDTNFSQDGLNATTDPAWFPQQTANSTCEMDFYIDPALLSYSGN